MSLLSGHGTSGSLRPGEINANCTSERRTPGQPAEFDRRLAPNEMPALGSHLCAPRVAYIHHGIYAGDGRVVHYQAFARERFTGAVEEVSLARFARGHALWVRPHLDARFTTDEILARARSRLGERRYSLLSNNCEHFTEWCVCGEPRSHQIERLLSLPRRIARLLKGASDSGALAGSIYGSVW